VNRSARIVAAGTAVASIVAFGAGSAASAGTRHGGAAAKAAAAATAARAALRYLTANPPATNRGNPVRRTGIGRLSTAESTNWSGYADDNTSGNSYGKVSGKWTEPAITCPTKEQQIAVFWIGIDGWNSSTVEQGGTLAQCFEGTAFYYTWWEMFPTNFIQTVGTTVKPGDKIAASVVKTGTSYAIKVTDSTTSGNNINTTQTCAATTCIDASAEWIAEAPGGPRGEYPLANFKKWTASAAGVTSAGTSGHISTFPDDEITMVSSFSGGYALAAPGALNSTATGFSVTWKNSY
jgi:Peptidase A4 family